MFPPVPINPRIYNKLLEIRGVRKLARKEVLLSWFLSQKCGPKKNPTTFTSSPSNRLISKFLLRYTAGISYKMAYSGFHSWISLQAFRFPSERPKLRLEREFAIG